MNKLTNVYCTYTGGGIYIVTAKYDDVYILSDLETYGTYDATDDDIQNKYDCDYDSHWKDSKIPLPTWAELLDAIRKSYECGKSANLSIYEVEQIMKKYHPNLSVRIDDNDSH